MPHSICPRGSFRIIAHRSGCYFYVVRTLIRCARKLLMNSRFSYNKHEIIIEKLQPAVKMIKVLQLGTEGWVGCICCRMLEYLFSYNGRESTEEHQIQKKNAGTAAVLGHVKTCNLRNRNVARSSSPAVDLQKRFRLGNHIWNGPLENLDRTSLRS